MYVEELIGPDTVNTMPEETIHAFQDHGEVALTLDARTSTRRSKLFDELARGRRRLRRRDRHARARGRAEVLRLVRRSCSTGSARSAASSPPREQSQRSTELVERIWERDPTVWTGADEAQWLGWLDEPQRMRERAGEIAEFASGCTREFDTFVLLGHGRLVASRPRCCGGRSAPSSSTSSTRRIPQAIRHAREVARPRADALRRLVEVRRRRSRRARTSTYFWEKAGATASSSSRSPIPAPRSSSWRTTRGIRASSHGEPTIGGRYSALSPFGIVPAALMGIDVDAAARERASRWRGLPRATATPGSSSACSSARAGATGATRSASTETDGRLRALGRAADRRVDGQAGQGPRAGARREPGRARPPGARRCDCRTRTTLGAEFFRWEFAAAVAGAILEINPFDQPDVQAAKDKTNEVLAVGRRVRASSPRARSTSCSRAPSRRLRRDPGVRRPDARERARSRSSSRARETGCVVTHGLGPRYLHSTGQLHKGGPPTGLFLQVVDDTGDELPIPGQDVRLRPAHPRAGRGRLRARCRSAAARSCASDWRTA